MEERFIEHVVNCIEEEIFSTAFRFEFNPCERQCVDFLSDKEGIKKLENRVNDEFMNSKFEVKFYYEEVFGRYYLDIRKVK